MLSVRGSQTQCNGDYTMSETDPALHDLEQLKKQAKSLLKAARSGDRKATSRFAKYGFSTQTASEYKLANAQLIIARDRSFESWRKLRKYIEESIADVFFAVLAEGKLRKIKLLLKEYPALKGAREKTSKLLPIQIASQQGNNELTRFFLALEIPRNTSKYLDLQGDSISDIWSMVTASYTGDLPTITSLVKRSPKLVNCYYDYQSPIHLAVINGHDAVAEYLIAQGADITCDNYSFNDSLVTTTTDRQSTHMREILIEALKERFSYYAPGPHSISDAVKGDDMSAVKRILKSSPDQVNICSESGNTPLHIAVESGNEKLTHYLIEQGADPNAINKDGFKPIHFAFFKNNFWLKLNKDLSLAEYLRDNGTKYNINLAALFDDLKGVQAFLSKDPSLSNSNDSCDKRPLSSAAAEGNEAMVKLLLENGADPMKPENNAPKGFALWVAAFKNHPGIVEMLLNAGADPHTMVHASGSAFTAGKNHPKVLEIFKRFTEIPIDPDPGEQKGLDPVVEAILDNDLEKVRQYLDENPSLATNNDTFYNEGYLSIAANREFTEIIDLLIERGATIPDQSNWAPNYAFKHLDLARRFLENGASPNHCNWLKRTILHDFSYRGDLDTVNLLLEFGAAIDPIDMEYQSTPLGFAARGGQVEVVKRLLEAGADPNLPEHPPWAKPLAWAKARNHQEVVGILEKRVNSEQWWEL